MHVFCFPLCLVMQQPGGSIRKVQLEIRRACTETAYCQSVVVTVRTIAPPIANPGVKSCIALDMSIEAADSRRMPTHHACQDLYEGPARATPQWKHILDSLAAFRALSSTISNDTYNLHHRGNKTEYETVKAADCQVLVHNAQEGPYQLPVERRNEPIGRDDDRAWWKSVAILSQGVEVVTRCRGLSDTCAHQIFKAQRWWAMIHRMTGKVMVNTNLSHTKDIRQYKLAAKARAGRPSGLKTGLRFIQRCRLCDLTQEGP
jgi:hypothetical protein